MELLCSEEEIFNRFSQIRNHRSKTNSKLNELGLLIASAYKLSPSKADDMWQYLTELNVKGQLENSKFYVAQVFKSILQFLPQNEAVSLLVMEPMRVFHLLIYGYDSNEEWKYMCMLLRYHIKLKDCNKCGIIVDAVLYKYRDSPENQYLAVKLCAEETWRIYCLEPQYEDIVLEFLRSLLRIQEPEINMYLKAFLYSHNISLTGDLDEFLEVCLKMDLPDPYMRMLFNNRYGMSDGEFLEKWLRYLEEKKGSFLSV